jgi:hypothetical protein
MIVSMSTLDGRQPSGYDEKSRTRTMGQPGHWVAYAATRHLGPSPCSICQRIKWRFDFNDKHYDTKALRESLAEKNKVAGRARLAGLVMTREPWRWIARRGKGGLGQMGGRMKACPMLLWIGVVLSAGLG